MRRTLGLALAVLGLGGLLTYAYLSAERGGASAAGAPAFVGSGATTAEPRGAAAAAARPPRGAAESASARAAAPSAPLAAETSAPGGARGALLVVEADGVTPRPDYAVGVLFVAPAEAGAATELVALRRATVVTDERGRGHCGADLALAGGARSARFFPALDLERRLEPFELPVSELSADPDAPTVLRLAPRDLRPVSALVVDAATGEPVPRVALRVQRWIELPDAGATPESHFAGGYFVATRFYDGSDCEWVISDATGRFTTERGYPTGRIGFLTIDQERADLHHDASAAVSEAVLRVPVGPVLRLDFAPGGGRVAEDYVAGIWRAPEELIVEDPIHEHPSPWSADRGARAGHWGNAVPVQIDDGPYVRPSVDQLSEPLPSFLYLLSRDGASFGFAPLAAFDRHRHEPLRVALREGHALRCAVVWPPDPERFGSADVVLESLDAPDDEPRESYASRMYAEAETPLLFPLLPPGAYRVRVSGEGLAELRQEVRLPHEGLLRLRPLPAAEGQLHVFTLRLRTDSGEPLDGQGGRAELRGVYLWPTEGASPSYRTAAIEWDGGVATLRYSGLTAGPHKAQVGWALGVHRVDGIAREFAVPGPAHELRVRDGEGSVQVEVRVVDPPATGALIVGASDSGSSHMNRSFQFGEEGERGTTSDGHPCVTFRAGPIGAEFRCNVWLGSEEHRLVRLEDEDIPAPDERGVRFVEIRSRPGWAARISVWGIDAADPDARARLPGVVLTLDGIEQLPTDERGQLDLSLDDTPQRLGVATQGWRLVTRTSWDDWGSVFADTGAFTVESGYLDVFLERTDG